eukprot:3059526-Rhodomonas_salina.1
MLMSGVLSGFVRLDVFNTRISLSYQISVQPLFNLSFNLCDACEKELVVVGGFDGQDHLKGCESFNGTGSWAQLPPLSAGRSGLKAVMLKGQTEACWFSRQRIPDSGAGTGAAVTDSGAGTDPGVADSGACTGAGFSLQGCTARNQTLLRSKLC